MTTKSELIIQWCDKNKIIYLMYHYGDSYMDCRYIHGAAEEKVKNVIGGFDDEQNYHKLPADIFKVKVTKSKVGYMAEEDYYAEDTTRRGDEYDYIFYNPFNLHRRKVTITWEEEEAK